MSVCLYIYIYCINLYYISYLYNIYIYQTLPSKRSRMSSPAKNQAAKEARAPFL